MLSAAPTATKDEDHDSQINIVSKELSNLLKDAKYKKEEIEKLKSEIKSLKAKYNKTIKEWNSLTEIIINQERVMEDSENKIAKFKCKQQILLSEISIKCYTHLKDISKEPDKRHILQILFKLIFLDNSKEPFDLIKLLKNENGIKNILEYSEIIYTNLIKEDDPQYQILLNLFNENTNNNITIMNQFPFNLIFEYISHIFSIIDNKISRDKQKEIIDNNIILKNEIFLNLKKLEGEIQKNEMSYKGIVTYVKAVNALSERFSKIKNIENNEKEIANMISTIEGVKKIDITNYVIYDNMSSLSVQSEYSYSEIASIQSNQSFINNMVNMKDRINNAKTTTNSNFYNNANCNNNSNAAKNKSSSISINKKSSSNLNKNKNNSVGNNEGKMNKKNSKIFDKQNSKNKFSSLNNNSCHTKKNTYIKDSKNNLNDIINSNSSNPLKKNEKASCKDINKNLGVNINLNSNTLLSNVKSQRHLPKPFMNQKTSLKISVAENNKLTKKSSFRSLKLTESLNQNNEESGNNKEKANMKSIQNYNYVTDIDNSIINKSEYIDTEKTLKELKNEINNNSNSKCNLTKNSNKKNKKKENKEKNKDKECEKEKETEKNKNASKNEEKRTITENDLDSINIMNENTDTKIKKINTMKDISYKNKKQKEMMNKNIYDNNKLNSISTNFNNKINNINERKEEEDSDEKYDEDINEEDNNYISTKKEFNKSNKNEINTNIKSDNLRSANNKNLDNDIIENNDDDLNQTPEKKVSNKGQIIRNSNQKNEENVIAIIPPNENDNSIPERYPHVSSNSFIVTHSKVLNEKPEKFNKMISRSDRKYVSSNEGYSDEDNDDDDEEDDEIIKNRKKKKANLFYCDENINDLSNGNNTSYLLKESICDEMISNNSFGKRINTNNIFIAPSGYAHHKTTRESYIPNVDTVLMKNGLPIKKKNKKVVLEKSTDFTCCSSGCSTSVV